jgi:hypothetical protein
MREIKVPLTKKKKDVKGCRRPGAGTQNATGCKPVALGKII